MSVYPEQRCIANHLGSLIGFPEIRDTNKDAYDFANEFSISDRNIIRKLSKQYRIIEIYQEEDNYFDDGNRRYIVQRKPYVIKYENWNVNNRELHSVYHRPFEWEFNLNY